MRVPVKLIRTEWPPNDGLLSGNQRFDDLLADIELNGILEPLTIRADWIVIDGTHRLSAARLLGIEHVDVRVWTGTEFVE